MSTHNPEKKSCFHCGLPVDPGLDISIVYQGEQKPMCCYGCQAVAQSIVDSGMDDFYRYRTSPAPKPEEIVPSFLQQLKAYDSDSVQDKFVDTGESGNTREVSLILEGITCAACVWLNEKHLNSLDGVLSASINYSNNRARVRWDNERIHLSEILESISRIGYMAHPYDPDRHQKIIQQERKRQLRRLGLSGVLGMQIMILAVAMYTGSWWGIDTGFEQSFRWLSFAFTLPLLLFASSTFFINAWRDLRHKRIGMDVPISLGIAIAFISSTINTIIGHGEVYYDSVAMFTFFLLSARYFESGARKQTSEATEALLNLKPAIATRFTRAEFSTTSAQDLSPAADDEQLETVAVSELASGDLLLVRPGEQIPEDAEIVEGSSGINESLVTGESLPVLKQPGDEVIGGTTNTENPLVIRVTRLGEDSVLSSIQRLLENAQQTKPAIARLADRIASWFVIVLLSIAAIIAVAWYMVDSSQWLEITIATLVVSCPCALSLATPTAITAASGRLAAIGLLPKSPQALETLSHASDFVFDKTGTLTEGRIVLDEIKLFRDDIDRHTVLSIAACLESRSEHPIAQAILSAYKNSVPGDSIPVASDLEHTTGSGIQGNIRFHDGDKAQAWYIGNAGFIQSRAGSDSVVPVPESADSHIYLADTDGLVAGFRLSDSLRAEAAGLVNELKAEQLGTHLLSGDLENNTSDIATQLGITNSHGAQKPEDKLAYVKQLQQQGAVVVMTGDGVNDAPVLAGASLSIAMGKGTQLAAAAADMVLISNSIMHIHDGYRVAVKTMRIIRQNLGWALLYNISAIPAAALGYVEPWLAAIGMSASSLIVVLNALRLTRR